jgi:hypothetical protein
MHNGVFNGSALVGSNIAFAGGIMTGGLGKTDRGRVCCGFFLGSNGSFFFFQQRNFPQEGLNASIHIDAMTDRVRNILEIAS